MTRKTHTECVKLIKKTGDTLALKLYTIVESSSSKSSESNNNTKYYSTSNELNLIKHGDCTKSLPNNKKSKILY